MNDESQSLEREAVALVREYKKWLIVFPKLRGFFLRLADFLDWQDLKGVL